MRLPRIHGIIRRRLLVNFRVDPEVIRHQLPTPFEPKLHDGHAIAGICLIRLEQIRPTGFPEIVGISSENAAHRVAVRWRERGEIHEGVYIPRRDTDSLINHVAGGRVFPGEHHRANFAVRDTNDRIELQMHSSDGSVHVEVAGTTSSFLPGASSFRNVADASAFFEAGSLGYSATTQGDRLDGLVLKTHKWEISPLAVERVVSSYFQDPALFPSGSAVFDCALIMRNIAHEWESAPAMHLHGAA